MKRKKLLAAVFCMAVLAGCASSSQPGPAQPASAPNPERRIEVDVPQFVRDAIKNAPEDALVGIGFAKMATSSRSMARARARARTSVARTVSTMAGTMIRNHFQGSKVDTDSITAFTESFDQQLYIVGLEGCKEAAIDVDDTGQYWAVVQMEKADVVKAINQAQAAAKLDVPEAASFDAEKQMDDAFAKVLDEEIPVVGKG